MATERTGLQPSATSGDRRKHDDAPNGAHRWSTLCDELLAGLVHGLNNRVTAMTVCSELLALGDRQLAADGMLATEIALLQRTTGLIALLPARGGPAEALELGPVLDDAVALYAHHPRLRAVGFTIERGATLPPLRAFRWALLRLLLLVLHAGASTADERRRDRVAVHLSADEARVQLRLVADAGAGDYADVMADRCGGAVERDGECLVLTLPSLAEMRRRERGSAPVR